jgi:hypothetical protein
MYIPRRNLLGAGNTLVEVLAVRNEDVHQGTGDKVTKNWKKEILHQGKIKDQI